MQKQEDQLSKGQGQTALSLAASTLQSLVMSSFQVEGRGRIKSENDQIFYLIFIIQELDLQRLVCLILKQKSLCLNLNLILNLKKTFTPMFLNTLRDNL